MVERIRTPRLNKVTSKTRRAGKRPAVRALFGLVQFAKRRKLAAFAKISGLMRWLNSGGNSNLRYWFRNSRPWEC